MVPNMLYIMGLSLLSLPIDGQSPDITSGQYISYLSSISLFTPAMYSTVLLMSSLIWTKVNFFEGFIWRLSSLCIFLRTLQAGLVWTQRPNPIHLIESLELGAKNCETEQDWQVPHRVTSRNPNSIGVGHTGFNLWKTGSDTQKPSLIHRKLLSEKTHWILTVYDSICYGYIRNLYKCFYNIYSKPNIWTGHHKWIDKL